ncbi:hypothetical protein PR048_022073 [Dryococelus australis]|uniref:Uncharacterized protein n=1 Tax=Dryococelus australis TaxID=614101 RepID=A0ABQ9H006_9NEOP|nr:hypothetical protein PR048_022073 [Dryococelus australis]
MSSAILVCRQSSLCTLGYLVMLLGNSSSPARAMSASLPCHDQELGDLRTRQRTSASGLQLSHLAMLGAEMALVKGDDPDLSKVGVSTIHLATRPDWKANFSDASSLLITVRLNRITCRNDESIKPVHVSGLIPGRVTPGFSQVGIVPDDASGQRVFSGTSHFPRPRIPALLHSHLISPSSALKTSLLRAAHISQLNSTPFWVLAASLTKFSYVIGERIRIKSLRHCNSVIRWQTHRRVSIKVTQFREWISTKRGAIACDVKKGRRGRKRTKPTEGSVGGGGVLLTFACLSEESKYIRQAAPESCAKLRCDKTGRAALTLLHRQSATNTMAVNNEPYQFEPGRRDVDRSSSSGNENNIPDTTGRDFVDVCMCVYNGNTRLCDIALIACAYGNHRDSGASKWKKTAVVNKMTGR